MEFANTECCGDYGWAFDIIWKIFSGLIPNGNEEINAHLAEIEERIGKLERREEFETKKLLSGKEIQIPKKRSDKND